MDLLVNMTATDVRHFCYSESVLAVPSSYK